MCFDMKSRFTKLLLVFLIMISADFAFAQKEEINNMISAVNKFSDHQALEKIYLQMDKPVYSVSDTVWFKAYLFDVIGLEAAKKSGILYVEIANDSNRLIKRIMLPVFSGLTYGSIDLSKESMPDGTYLLSAYTNWMQNFGDQYIFKKTFYISNATDQDWLIAFQKKVNQEKDKSKIQLQFDIKQYDHFPVGLRELQFKVTDEKKTWFKGNVETTYDGLLNLDFELPASIVSNKLNLNITDLRKGQGRRLFNIPLPLNRMDHIDLQFMPEGGALVAGLPARVAFKAINEDGLGVHLEAKVYDAKGQQVALLSGNHKGMGSFDLIPQAAEQYTARLSLPDGSYKNYPLPAVKLSGLTMKIANPLNKDSCEVIVSATPDRINSGSTYFLMGQARGKVYYGASFKFKKRDFKIMVSKHIFPDGIVRFTLTGADKIALSERVIFIDHSETLNIALSQNKATFKPRDSVSIDIKVTDNMRNPVQGSFSVAITDDGQVKTDSIATGSMLTHLFLTDDLKGNVEDPGYYLQALTDSVKWHNLDELLLAQGWMSYDWNDVFKPEKVYKFDAEPEFLIKGKVTNVFNKPVAKSGITLLSKKPVMLMDTITNAQGIFTFKGVFPSDTAVFFIQARNKNGKSNNVGIEMEEFKPPVFVTEYLRQVPWNVNVDTGNRKLVDHKIQMVKDQRRIKGTNMLKEVEIKAKKVITDSKNLNGPGGADVIIGEDVLERSGRTTLGDLIRKNVKGFGLRYTKTGAAYYAILNKPVHLIIDGLDTEFFLPTGMSLDQYFRQYFDYYDAEEIKGIEVMVTGKYQMSYGARFLDAFENPFDNAFIEVTTRGGKGPFVKKAVGTYIYKPMPFSLPKQFYAPKYKIQSQADGSDIRSTIFWEPNIVTDKDGKASISFYTADKPGNYSLIMEGSDMQGAVGVKRARIVVEK
jgi:hypothetical protein